MYCTGSLVQVVYSYMSYDTCKNILVNSSQVIFKKFVNVKVKNYGSLKQTVNAKLLKLGDPDSGAAFC